MYNPLLFTFIIVADSGSFTKASEKMYITPASIMHQINTLEQHLEIKLFERTKKGLQLTEAGKMLYKDAKRFIKESQKCIEKVKAFQNNQQNTIRIGSSFLNPCHSFIQQFQATIQDTSFTFKIIPYSDEADKIVSIVQQLGIDIDILIGAFNSEQMYTYAKYLPLGTYDLCIAMSPKHPLSKKQILEISDLYGETLIIPTQEKENDVLHFFQQHPQIHVESNQYYYDLDTFNQCESQNYLLLTLSAWKNIHPSLKTIPVNWNMKVPFGILYAKHPEEKIKMLIQKIVESNLKM